VRAAAWAWLAVLLATASLASGCKDNMLTGSLKPVPPVHRVPLEIEGRAILVGEDADIESRDPVHISRAREARVPQDLRAAMTNALALAGFKVVTTASEPHDLVAKLAIAVREESGHVYQTYRCGLRGVDGTEVAQIDWAWPEDVYVGEYEVYDYASHNVATEIATSRRVSAYLRRLRSGAGAGAGAGAGRETASDGGAPPSPERPATP
jgi:hypothetical protein